MRRVVRRRIRRQSGGVNLVADVNVTAASGSTAGEAVSSRQVVRIVQRSKRRAAPTEDRR